MKTEDYKKLTRLYVPEDFAVGETCALSEGQAHYLRNVMRKAPGDVLRVFNGRTGDWLAKLTDVSKNKAFIQFDKQISEQKPASDIWILGSPIKKEAFDLMIEKSCELGAAKFIPVICDHTVVHKANQDRLQAVAIEAAEQCERSDVMEVAGLVDLKRCLNSFDNKRKLIFCMERGEAPMLAAAMRSLQKEPLALLIGPEGGFSDGEVEYIRRLPFVHPVSLGPRILRAETAALAALAVVQALH